MQTSVTVCCEYRMFGSVWGWREPLARLRYLGVVRKASGSVGWNSSIGLPDGSSSRICLPPTPVTMSLRKCASAFAELVDRGGEVGEFEHEAIPASRLGLLAVRHRLTPAAGTARCAQHQAQIASDSIAKPGAGSISSLKPRWSQ